MRAIRWIAADPAAPTIEKGRSWFSALFDIEDDRTHADTCAEAYRRGHYMVVADVERDSVDRCVEIRRRHGAVDIDRRAMQWSKTGYKGFDRTAKPLTGEARARELASYRTDTKDMAIPVVQEELAIGKRVVSRGGVRVHSYVEEKPVQEVVRLREERVNVQRRPVNRPATAGDMAFQNRSVDVTAMGEEPVIDKTARVVEEVVVNKDVGQRTETVKETVRRKDVKVDKIDSQRGVDGTCKGTP